MGGEVEVVVVVVVMMMVREAAGAGLAPGLCPLCQRLVASFPSLHYSASPSRVLFPLTPRPLP